MLNEQLQKQIEQEAKAYASLFKHGEDFRILGYKDGAIRFADRLQEAQQLVERYEKALKQIEQMSDPGDYWKAIIDMKAIASEALTPKTGSDE